MGIRLQIDKVLTRARIITEPLFHDLFKLLLFIRFNSCWSGNITQEYTNNFAWIHVDNLIWDQQRFNQAMH